MRNEVLVSIGSFLSNGTLTLPDDGAEVEDDDPAAAEKAKHKKGKAATAQPLQAVEEGDEDGDPLPGAVPLGGSDGDEDDTAPLSSIALSDSARADLLSLLCSRTHDVHAFTRSKALQTLIALTRVRTLPPQSVFLLPALAIDRLLDTSSHVRKYAVALLSAVMQFNPLGPDLCGEAEARQLQEMGAVVEEVRRMEDERKRAAALRIVQRDEERRKQRQSNSGEAGGDDEEDELNDIEELPEDDLQDDDAAVDPRVTTVTRLTSALAFVHQLHSAVPAVLGLLASRTSSDVVRAIDFFVTARQFNVPQAESGVRALLSLIWSREQAIRDAVLDAYRRLYIGEELSSLRGPALKKRALMVAGGLVRLTIGASLSTLQSLSEYVTRSLHADLLPAAVVEALVDTFTASAGVSDAERTGALLLLGIVANTGDVTVTAALTGIVRVGLGKGAADPLLTRTACEALQRVTSPAYVAAGTKPASTDLDGDVLQGVLQSLEAIVLDQRRTSCAVDWYTAAEQCIRTLFLLHPQPDLVSGRILHALTHTALYRSSASAPSSLGTAESLSRLFFVVGQVAVAVLIRLERTEQSLKRLRQAERDGSAERRRGAKEVKKGKGGKGKREVEEEKEAAEPAAGGSIEDDLAVGASEEFELETLRERAERSLVDLNNSASSSSLLAVYAPLLLAVVRQPAAYAHERLQVSAVLALCKLMMASAAFCSAHLPLLMAVWRQSAFPAVRANLIIALGDLCSRHPNVLEPWSSQLYVGLHDRVEAVAVNTMLVLTHLLLNDMLKVKAAVVSLAALLVSPDARMASMARVFFTELSGKAKSPIYNLLPSMLSRMSHPSSGLSQAQLQSVLSFLLGFINKDRHTESLIDKLAQRMGLGHVDEFDDADAVLNGHADAVRVSVDVDGSGRALVTVEPTRAGERDEVDGQLRVARDAAFCLGQLSYSLASAKKLLSLFPLYEATLGDALVHARLVAAVQRSRKFAKPDIKAVLDELETRLNAAHARLQEESRVTARSKKAVARAKGPHRRTECPGAGSEEPGEAEEDGADADECDKENRPANRRGRGRGAASNTSASTGKTPARPTRGKAAAAAAKGRKGRGKKDSEDEEDEGMDDEEEDDEDEDGDESIEEMEEDEDDSRVAPAPQPLASRSRRELPTRSSTRSAAPSKQSVAPPAARRRLKRMAEEDDGDGNE